MRTEEEKALYIKGVQDWIKRNEEKKKMAEEKKEKEAQVKLGTTKIQKRKEKDEGILMIERASSYAAILKDIIEKQKLYVDVEGRKFVTCEGWQVLGALLKCTAKITNVTKTNEGYYAEAEISNIEGKVLGKGQALCKFDETITRKDGTTFKRWDNEFKTLSMAQTRAVSKAFRLSFSWILKIAGYEVTPAEEMV